MTRSSGLRLTDGVAARALPPPPAHSSNPLLASPAGYTATRVWAPPRSLAATKGILSVPRGTEMFQFPRCPLRDCSQSARPCAGRVAPFGHPRIAGCQRLPGAFRRVAASFLGRQRQGIHHAPIMRISCMRSPPGCVATATADRLAPAGRSRPAAPDCCLAPAIPSMGRGVFVCGLVRTLMMRSSARGRADTNPRTPPVTRGGAGLGSRCPVRIVPRTPSDHRRLPRPQNPAGSAWRVVKVHNDPKVVSEVVKPRPKPSSDLGRDLPTHGRSADRGWRAGTTTGGPRPGVEPRGFEPRTSAVQGRRSPS